MTAAFPYEARIAALRAAMESQGLQGAILSRPEHLFYFSGALPGPSPAFLIVSAQSLLAVSPQPLGSLETITYPEYDLQVVQAAAQALEQAVQRSDLLRKATGLEMAHLPAAYARTIQRRVAAAGELEPLLWRLRRIKDAAEIAQIETNVAGNDRIFQGMQQVLRPGLSELEVWSWVQQSLNENAGCPVILEGNLGASLRASDPDARPGPARLHSGEVVFLDIYSATRGYYADTTRVFTLGSPDSRQLEIHAVLLAAQAAGEAQLKPGVPANVVDAAVRGVIEQAGYGPNFPHHSGHAFGLFQQERPFLVPSERTVLEQGMALTLEPGIYLPGWGGMRIESDYLIEGHGPRRLDQFPRELCVCA